MYSFGEIVQFLDLDHLPNDNDLRIAQSKYNENSNNQKLRTQSINAKRTIWNHLQKKLANYRNKP